MGHNGHGYHRLATNRENGKIDARQDVDNRGGPAVIESGTRHYSEKNLILWATADLSAFVRFCD